MNPARNIAKNTSVMLISQITSYIFGFFYVMYVARYLGAAGYGIISFALAFTGIFSNLTDPGLNSLILRDIARDKSLVGKYLGNIGIITIILGLITLILIIITINALDYPEETVRVVYLIAISVIFNVFTNILYAVFQAYEKMEYRSFGTIMNSAILLAGALFAIYQELSVTGFAAIYVISSIVSLGYAYYICAKKFVVPKLEIDWDFWIAKIREALPFGIVSLSIVIYYHIDKVMLSLMIDNEAVGYYSAAYTIATSLLFFYSAFSAAVFPCMSNCYGNPSKESFVLIFEKSVKCLWMIALPLGVGITLLAERIIILIYGAGYSPSVIALQILVWAHVVIYMNSYANVLNNIGKQFLVAKQTIICALLNILLNFLLIPEFSYIGASIATLITESFAFILLYYYVSKTEYKLSKSTLSILFVKFLSASLVMAIFIKYFEDLNLVTLIISAIIIYFVTLIIIKAIEKEELQIIYRLVKKVN